MTNNKEVITSSDFRRMIAGAYSEFLLEYENLNQLNAASLSDSGEIGTNLLRTMGAAAAALADAKEEGIGPLAKRTADSAILGARGNSGVVLSQIFRGLSKGLSGKYDAGSSDIGKAFQYGILYAHRSIPDSKERPIITVAKGVAKGAYHAVRANLPISEILEAALIAGEKELQRTKQQYGFIDAGGQGMMVLLTGCMKGLDGNFVSPSLSLSTNFKTSNQVPKPEVDLVRPYCVSFLVKHSKVDVYDVERILQKIGNAVVVQKHGSNTRVHLHTDHPGLIIEQAVGWGNLHDVKIDNMAQYHESRVMTEHAEALAIIAVASDADMSEKMKKAGASLVIIGGRGMNPSVGDFVNAVHSDFAKQYIILPNSKNIVLVVEQVQELLGDRVANLKTQDMQSGLQALTLYKKEQSLAENVRNMQPFVK
jgi:hypothetical protein